MSFTAIFYPLSIGYAVLRHNLLQVDVFVRRTLNYALLTAIATIAYAGLVQALDFLFNDAPASFGFVLTLLLVMLILPLRDRVQSIIDRVFFRSAYDFRRIVETTSARLTSESDLTLIADDLSQAVDEALHPESIRLYVRRDRTLPFCVVPHDPEIPHLPEMDVDSLRDATTPVDEVAGGLCLPFRADGELLAVLALGRPQSGQLYGADDRRLLQTLANQGAIAIENALALEQLRELNRDLEAKVEERTQELREAHAQLVHREKMASLGQFVAGIAHEINNPLNFIQGNLHCLREYVGVLRGTLESYEAAMTGADPAIRHQVQSVRKENELDDILDDIESAFEGCAEGVERSTALVGDLRTFSRLDSPDRTETNVHSSIASTLNLLRSRLHGIEVVKHFGEIPPIECISGQIDQVFVNLVANAADALDSGGRLEIRTETLPSRRVAVEVIDNGPGIAQEILDRIFDPFFTTKPVGKGTGLGLSISYGIVTRHGGTITVKSRVGEGACFRIELPVECSDD
jgi:signal transduction histidine kinase